MNERQYRLGLVSVSFRANSPKEILDAVARAGLSCIEWGSDVHAPCTDLARLTELAELQRQYGVECSSYGTYFRLGETPIGELPAYIEAARLLGTDVLRLWCGRKCGADMTPEEREALLADCRQAALLAEENGVTLCLECHRKTFTENPEDAVWLLREVASAHFRMYWQPFQWQDAEQNRKNAQRIAPYAEHVHVFHWKGDAKLPLSGAIGEWQDYLTAFATPRTLLLEFMPNGGIEELEREAAALKTIIGENE